MSAIQDTSDTILVYENNDPVLHFYFYETVYENGMKVQKPIVLTGATISMFIKASPQTADSAAVGTWTVISAPNGLADLQLLRADCGSVGRRYFRVDVTKAGKTQTAKAGSFIVKDS